VIRHHPSNSGATSAADDPVLDGVTITSTAGRPGPTDGPVAKRDAVADTCRASCNHSLKNRIE